MSDPLPDLPAAAALRWAIWCRLLAAGTAAETAVGLAGAVYDWITTATPPPARTTRAANPAVLETVREMVSAGERVTGASLAARLGCSQGTASARLRELVSAGQLRQEGATTSLRYVLADTPGTATTDGEPRRSGPSLALPPPATERAALDWLASVGRPARPDPARAGLWHMDGEDGLTWRQVVGRANSLRVTALPALPPFILPDIDPPSGSAGCSLEIAP